MCGFAWWLWFPSKNITETTFVLLVPPPCPPPLPQRPVHTRSNPTHYCVCHLVRLTGLLQVSHIKSNQFHYYSTNLPKGKTSVIGYEETLTLLKPRRTDRIRSFPLFIISLLLLIIILLWTNTEPARGVSGRGAGVVYKKRVAGRGGGGSFAPGKFSFVPKTRVFVYV